MFLRPDLTPRPLSLAPQEGGVARLMCDVTTPTAPLRLPPLPVAK